MLVVQERQPPLAGWAEAPAPAASATGDLTLSVYSTLSDVETAWRSFENSADCTAFQTFAWHRAWQDSAGALRGVRPAIVVGRHGGHTLFILPFAIVRGRLARRLVWHASELCDYNAPLLAGDFTAVVGDRFPALFDKVLSTIATEHRFDTVALTKMPELVGGQRNPFMMLATTPHSNGAYMMRIGGTWEEFYREKRSSATRRHDRSKRKHLAEFGEVSFVTAEDPCTIEATLDALFAQKAASFAARGVPNFLARCGTREFFRALGADPFLRDSLHVSRLQVGSIIAAANLGIVFRGRYYHVLASYDGGPVSRFGPGTAHLHELIGYALQRGCELFDFTVGDEPYKRDWCDTEMRLHDYRAAKGPRGWLAAMVSKATARAKLFVKRTPRLSRALHQLLAARASVTGNRAKSGERFAAASDEKRP